MRLLKKLILLLTVLNIPGCSFHLRGLTLKDSMEALPFNKAYIVGAGKCATNLRQQLSFFNDISQPVLANDAQLKIIVLKEHVEQKILTINKTGRVSEYRIYLSVSYQIHYQKEVLLEMGQLKIFRDYSYNDQAILGKESEQGMLIKDMYQDAANQILRRATTLVKKNQTRLSP